MKNYVIFHPAKNPFPVTRPTDGATIVDERCACGCLRSEHADTIAFGHGLCTECSCPKFSWRGMVIQNGNPEVAQ